MKPDVLELKPSEPNDSVVKLTKKLLEGAESGKIRALSVAWEVMNPERGRETFYESSGGGTWALLGGLSMLQSDVIEALREPSRIAGEED